MTGPEDDEQFLELRLEGSNVFTPSEAERIRAWISTRPADETELHGFVLSDWTQTPDAFAPSDFDELLRLGFVEIED